MGKSDAPAGRYTPGGYKLPENEEIDIEGVGTFLVRALPNKEQSEIQKGLTRKPKETDVEFASRTSFNYISHCLVDPKMTPEEVEAECDQWTVRQGTQFVTRVLRAADVADEEDPAAIRRRFRS